ncbi:hypothetical protein [Dyella silvatica]|uniref:hypothetical protein n=1 Tax=Dyella silvatica TaxID=2992128 RepID=UPI00224CCFA3|nr:hypothetical protein [Dyella silvatica]
MLMKSTAISALLLFSTACSGVEMKPFYPKTVVEPVTVHKLSDNEISIRYRVYPESNHYSNGVNYEKIGDALKVVIGRCSIGETCEPMAKTVIPLDDKWEAEVHIPYHGEKIILVHSGAEEQIYP